MGMSTSLRNVMAAVGVLGLLSSLVLPAQAAEPKLRMLMVTRSVTFEHGPVKRKDNQLSIAEVAVTQLGQTSGLFTVDCTKEPKADVTRDNLKKYDLVFFYTQGELGIEKDGLDYFLNEWLKQKGHGFIGTHSATDTGVDYQPYWDMVGGSFDGHPWNANETVSITVHEPSHPTVKMWGEKFQIQDEIYQYKNWQPEKVRVLMSLNMAECKTKAPRHVPVSWVKQYGDGRVFYTNLGHNDSTWANPKYLDHILTGIKWAAGKIDGEAAPNPELSKAQEEKAKKDAGG